MSRPSLFLGLMLVALGAGPGPAHGQDSIPSIADKTRGMTAFEGFLPLYWDAASGKVWLEVPALGEELIYAVSLTTGVGSNDIGLDRGQLGGERIVRFERVGPRVFLVQPNYAYRAESDDPDERLAVEEAFAISTLWGFAVAAETDGRVLVDASDFVLRDAHGVSGALDRRGQGSFDLDRDRSAVYLPRTKAFPRNSEIEVSLMRPGTRCRACAAAAQRHTRPPLPASDR